tara:strand:+ start:531 stop:644 length:114 start_codon:yes stop_codon:yes gene_type:complete
MAFVSQKMKGKSNLIYVTSVTVIRELIIKFEKLTNKL